ncbi:MAG: hypothetical protein AAF790_12555, partial [Planctomycetota bacterium]
GLIRRFRHYPGVSASAVGGPAALRKGRRRERKGTLFDKHALACSHAFAAAPFPKCGRPAHRGC